MEKRRHPRESNEPNCYTLLPDGAVEPWLTLYSTTTVEKSPQEFRLSKDHRERGQLWGPVFSLNLMRKHEYVNKEQRKLRRYHIMDNGILLLVLTGIPIINSYPLTGIEEVPTLLDQVWDRATNTTYAELWLLLPGHGVARNGKTYWNDLAVNGTMLKEVERSWR